MLRRAAAAIVAALVLTGCAKPADPSVLAMVGGTEVRVDYVQTLMPPEGSQPVRVAGEPHPLQAALALAIRDELLVQEAERRGLTGDTRAEQLAALLAAERAATPGLVPESITDVEARTWYAGHRRLFDEVATARASWVEVADEGAAREAYRTGTADRTVQVRDLVPDQAEIRGSGVASIQHGGGADEMVQRITNAVRRPGGLGLDVEPETGSWFLVRVEALSLEPTPWEPALADRVRSAMAWDREQEHLAAMADRLREERTVQVFGERVQALIDE